MRSERTLTVAELGCVDYAEALALQERLLAMRIRNRVGDLLLLLEHPHVFTLGSGAREEFVLERCAEVPIYRVPRGGEVTYHGPGQLVGYPIIALEGERRDAHRYLRDLEETLIAAVASFGVAAERRAGLTGVWVANRKLASIGVGIRRWVTWHGFALNLAPDLKYFKMIVPCGLVGCEMVSLHGLGVSREAMREMPAVVAECFAARFDYETVARASRREIELLAGLPPLREAPGAAGLV